MQTCWGIMALRIEQRKKKDENDFNLPKLLSWQHKKLHGLQTIARQSRLTHVHLQKDRKKESKKKQTSPKRNKKNPQLFL